MTGLEEEMRNKRAKQIRKWVKETMSLEGTSLKSVARKARKYYTRYGTARDRRIMDGTTSGTTSGS